MIERTAVPSWVPVVILAELIGSGIVAFYFNFLPYIINIVPIIALFVGLILSGVIRKWMRICPILKNYYNISILISLISILVLLLDYFCDTSSPSTLSAQVSQFHRASRSATSSLLLESHYPDGRVFKLPVRSSLFDHIPSPGAIGKIEIGRGFLRIPYLKRVEFNDNDN